MADSNKPTILRFKLAVERPFDPFTVFFPQGHQVLNRTTWRGKEPRSCAVTSVRGGPQSVTAANKFLMDVEVSYRPKGFITFVGTTKYDGWTAMMLDKRKDGVLLDGHGNPLQPGQADVYRPFEVYDDAEFNEIDFGEFVEEVEVEGVRHIGREQVEREIYGAGQFEVSITSSFIAPRRQRPLARIVLNELPFASSAGGSADLHSIFLNKNDPHFKRTLFDRLYEVAAGYVEGRFSVKSMSAGDHVFVMLSDCLMELQPPTEGGRELRSVFNVFATYVSSEDMEEIAKRLMAVYDVDVAVVDGDDGGFLMRRIRKS